MGVMLVKTLHSICKKMPAWIGATRKRWNVYLQKWADHVASVEIVRHKRLEFVNHFTKTQIKALLCVNAHAQSCIHKKSPHTPIPPCLL